MDDTPVLYFVNLNIGDRFTCTVDENGLVYEKTTYGNDKDHNNAVCITNHIPCYIQRFTKVEKVKEDDLK